MSTSHNMITVDGVRYYTVKEVSDDGKWHGPFWLKRVDESIVLTDLLPGEHEDRRVFVKRDAEVAV